MNNTPPKKLKSMNYTISYSLPEYSLDWVDIELIPKSGITNYIKERIETLNKEKDPILTDKIELYAVMCQIMELQAVLSKLEELKTNK